MIETTLFKRTAAHKHLRESGHLTVAHIDGTAWWTDKFVLAHTVPTDGIAALLDWWNLDWQASRHYEVYSNVSPAPFASNEESKVQASVRGLLSVEEPKKREQMKPVLANGRAALVEVEAYRNTVCALWQTPGGFTVAINRRLLVWPSDITLWAAEGATLASPVQVRRQVQGKDEVAGYVMPLRVT